MSIGTPHRPLRVAIIGSGPSGFYAAEPLLTQKKYTITVDMFDRLPVPYGLVRYGVAPDHPKIKSVIKVYEKVASFENFCFIGNVEINVDVTYNELKHFYDAIIFATGAELDKKLGIDNEDLPGCHNATEFVGWYNGHPDFQNRHFDFSHEVAVVIGQGNVAMDVCRILAKSPDELKNTDITQSALEQLSQSKIKEIHCFGRRGPAQAAFTPAEIKEFKEIQACDIVIDPQDLILNEESQQELADPANASKKRNYATLQDLCLTGQKGHAKKFFLHFFRNPFKFEGKTHVEKVIFEKTKLIGKVNNQSAESTKETESIASGLVFKSVGYRGQPIVGVPFDYKKGLIPNQEGRVLDGNSIFPGVYAVGWIKHGAKGVIGANKPLAEESVAKLLDDVSTLKPCENPDSQVLFRSFKSKSIKIVHFDDWKKIDQAEIERGKKFLKPREKFISIESMLKASESRLLS